MLLHRTEIEQVRRAAAAIRRTHQVKLVARQPEWEEVRVPPLALQLITSLLDALATGNPVAVVRVNAELTIQQAADFLAVPKASMVELLDAGKIPARGNGPRRRILIDDLLNHRGGPDAASVSPARIAAWPGGRAVDNEPYEYHDGEYDDGEYDDAPPYDEGYEFERVYSEELF